MTRRAADMSFLGPGLQWPHWPAYLTACGFTLHPSCTSGNEQMASLSLSLSVPASDPNFSRPCQACPSVSVKTSATTLTQPYPKFPSRLRMAIARYLARKSLEPPRMVGSTSAFESKAGQGPGL